MPQTKRIKSIEIGENYTFQQKEWIVERIGWVAMAVIILLALLGFFGGGPLSSATESGPGGFQVSYERFDRQMNPSQLILELPPEAIQEGKVRFWIDREYLEQVQVEDISPDPDSVEVSGERLIYTIRTAGPGQPVRVKLDIQMQETGLREGQAGLDGGDSISFSQFVFP